MLRALAQAALAPFRLRRAAFVSSILLIGLPLFLLVGVGLTAQLSLSATTFFVPDGSMDPVLLQHMLWFAGHPETFALTWGASVILLGPVSVAIWWRALAAEPVRPGFARVVGVALWLWLGLSVMVLSRVYFALVPPSPGWDALVFALCAVGSLTLLFRLRPRFYELLEGTRPAPLGWPVCLSRAGAVAGVAIVAQLVGLLLWLVTQWAGNWALGAFDGHAPRWVAAIVFLDWFQIWQMLDFAYAALVLFALIRAPGEPRAADTGDAGAG